MSIMSIDIVFYSSMVTNMATNNQTADVKQAAPAWLQVVQEQVGAIRFGVVQITIHESRVVQVERTEKVRLDRLEKEEG